jgi:hypothetical protein
VKLDVFPRGWITRILRTAGRECSGVPTATLPQQDLFVRAVIVANDGDDPVRIEDVRYELIGQGVCCHEMRVGGPTLAERLQADAELLSGLPPPLVGFIFGGVAPELSLRDAADGTVLPGRAAGVLFEHLRITSATRIDACRITVTYRSERGPEVLTTTLPVRAHTPRNVLRFPLEGRIFVWTGYDNPHMISHRRLQSQEFALDLVELPSQAVYHPESGRNADYAGYGMDVHAAADGTVVAVEGAAPENPGRPGDESDPEQLARQAATVEQLGLRAGLMGNHVILRHPGDEHSLYVHLVTGSPTVKPGDPVRQGQVIGRLGNSGISGGPHLHFSLMDGPDPLTARGLPCSFAGLRHLIWDLPLDEHPLECGWIVG